MGRLAETFAVPRGRDARIFAVASVVDALGNGLYLPVAALFFVKAVGLPVEQVGLGLSLTGVVALAGHVVGGPPIDRYGARNVVLVLCGVRAVAYAAYPLVGGFWSFVALASFTHLADNVGRVGLQALVASLVDPRDRVTTAAFVRSVRNIGYGVGGLLVSAALAVGGRGPYVALVLGNAASFVLAGVLLSRVREVRAPRPQGPRTGYREVLRDRRYVALTAVHGLLSLHLTVLLIGFPLWIDQRTDAPTAIAGAIFTLNSALVVLLQVPFSRRSGTVAEGGNALRRCGFALLATSVLLALTQGLPAYAAVALLLVTGVVECVAELEEASGGWAVSLGLSPDHARGRYLGVWALGYSVHEIAGPGLMGLIVARGGGPGFVAFGAVMAVAGVVAARLARHAVEPLPERLDAVDGRVDDRDPAPG